MENNTEFPNCKNAKMLVMTLAEFRKAIAEFYADIMPADIQEMLTHGKAGAYATFMNAGIENMGISELIEAADAWLGCTMDCDDSIDGIIVYDDTVNSKPAVVACHDFKS